MNRASIEHQALPGAVTVRPVITPRQRDLFVAFPWRIYATDPQWVPPLRSEVREFIDPRRHPFYRHGDAQPLLAFRGDEPVGRLIVSDDPHYNAEHGTNLGAFGLFESLDDPEVARALIDAAADWLRQRGRNAIWGPVDYSTNYPCGLLVEGFDTPPRLMMNHQPTYYASLLESTGLRQVKDLYAFWFDDPHEMLNKWKSRAERLSQRAGFTIRPFDVSHFKEDVQRVKEVYNAAWERNWGFVKMSDEEFLYLAQSIRRFALPELLLIAEVEGQAVGFSITLPDVNEAIRPLAGHFSWWNPLSIYRFWRGLKNVRTARMAVLGVRSEFRRRGVTEMLILKTLDYGRNQARFTGAELGWTLEDNDLINRTIEAVGGVRYKRYRLYERAIVG